MCFMVGRSSKIENSVRVGVQQKFIDRPLTPELHQKKAGRQPRFYSKKLGRITDQRHRHYGSWPRVNRYCVAPDYAALVNTLICLIARIQAGQSQPNFFAAASLSSSVKTIPASKFAPISIAFRTSLVSA